MMRKPSKPGKRPRGAGKDSKATEAQPSSDLKPMADAPVAFIELDHAISGGYIHNRFDLTIRGRVTSVLPIREVRLQADNQVISLASYGQAERAAVCVLPDGRLGRQRAFQFYLPRTGDSAPGKSAFAVTAGTEDNVEHTQTFEVGVDPDELNPVAVLVGPTGSAPIHGAARPHSIVYIERAAIDGGSLLTVQGWAVALSPILTVKVFVGDQMISDGMTGGARGDVAAAYPGYPHAGLSGFGLTVRLSDAHQKAETIRVQIICADGHLQEASIPTERLFNRARLPDVSTVERTENLAAVATALNAASPIEMYCDTAELSADGVLRAEGWAICAAGIAQIRVQLNGRDIGLATYGHQRADVGGAFPAIPMAHLSGFKFEARLNERLEGEHTVRVVVCGAQGSESKKQVSVVVSEAAGTLQPAPADQRGDAFEPSAEQAAEFRFELDSPGLSNSVMIEPVTGRLTIEGWLLTRSGISAFEVFLNDQRLGDAHYGLARQDVGAAFPDWPNALRSGFAFHCPPRSLRDGEHTIRLAIRAENNVTMDRSFHVSVRKSGEADDAIGIRRRVPRVEADMIQALLTEQRSRPVFQVVLRQGPVIDGDAFARTLESLRLQPFYDWHVSVLAADDDVAASIRPLVDDQLPRLTGRFTIIAPAQADRWHAPLCDGSDNALTLNMLLLPGDELGADALLELALAAGNYPDRDLLYGDEVRLSPVSLEKEPFFKPDYSPDLLLSTNYIGRPWVARSSLLAKTMVTPAELVAAGEYDLILRCAEQAQAVHHVPKLLCQRATAEIDDPMRERVALIAALSRRAIKGLVQETAVPGTWRVKRELLSCGKVSIIIPTFAAHGYIETCLRTLRDKTSYPDYEIICIDNIPASQSETKAWLRENVDEIVDIPTAFNWSVFNNQAAAVARGEYLLFLNDDIEITHEDWLHALVENAQRPEVAIVGPQLLYRDGKVQHAGMFLSNNGVGRHAFRFAAKDDPCYFGLALTQRNVIAVTGACMLVRRETFNRLGKFDEAHEIINNDLDFCLRAHRAGMLTVYTPYASLIHYELASRAGMRDVFDSSHFSATWKTTFAAGDPYFNPRLSRQTEDYRPDDEPVQWVVPGTPLFHADEIERILVVKLDHIGDFVTALPPIRRLKAIFPKAQITVLAGRGSRDFVALEPSIDNFIPFSFFHARSQLGEREVTADEYAELADRLYPYRFDLAVDLRKHPSTRDVLKYTGARFLAGFDYLGQFPFLDIALDWDGDRNLQRKRNHIVDDLLGLVNAIGHATESDRQLIQPSLAALPLSEMPKSIQALFSRPVVAIHPGAGNVTKQWPEAHFSALIDLLIEKNRVNVLLVGGPDDAAIADNLLSVVLHKRFVASMAGKTSLAVLPRLLRNCVLYIGNDSGPKHIAAAVGIPTIGIHSGVVDPVEWGPIGPTAVALRRNMACSPCYLANADHCPRALACLKFFDPAMVYETANMMLKAAESKAVTQDASPRKGRARPRVPVSEPA